MRLKGVRAVASTSLALIAAGIVWFDAPGRAQVAGPPTLPSQISRLSEPGGYFDTDNLVSNERSYLQVLPALKQGGVAGGAYVGVGPDQNFSYIAAIRPSIAYLIDVRRDNLLLHLLFKALFAISATRAEYLSHLFARPLSTPPDQWRAASLEKIAGQIDRAVARDEHTAAIRKLVEEQVSAFGVPLTPQDVLAIGRFHQRFIEAGLSLKFQSHGRAPRAYYPTYRELLFETDSDGRTGNFLMSESDYQFVRRLHQRDLIIPVVGNLAGPSALNAIGRALRQRGEEVSAVYVSNVELYLFQDGVFARYFDNLTALPRNPRSVIIRSIFDGSGSASETQRIDDFAARKPARYGDLLGR